MQHDFYPIGLLESEYGVSTSIMFNYQGELANGFRLLNHDILIEKFPDVEFTESIIVMVVKRTNTYEVIVEYNSAAYEPETMNRLVDLYIATVEEMLN